MVDTTKCSGVTAIVEYDYTAKEPDELDLVKGAILHTIKQMPGGWWEGTLQTSGKTGMFPDNFVRIVDMNEDNSVVLRDKASTSNRRCKVIYSYTQVNDDELSLAVGDVIEFLGEVEEGWWRGRLNNKIGVFPSNFVKLIDPSPVFASKRPPSTAKTTLNNSSFASSKSGTVLASSSTVNTAASSSLTSSTTTTATKKLNRLSFHNSKENLLNSTANSASSSTIASNTALLAGGEGEDAAPSLPPKPQREFCRVEFPYAPQNEDELELKVGEIITVHSMELPDKGWWKGEVRGKVGVFPDNFVKLMATTEVSPLNDTLSQPQQTHRTAKTTNNLSTAATTGSTSSIKTLIKKSGSSSSTQSSNRKDSFGSRDSLNDILSETGLPTGNVAAQRKSLENKNFDLTNASDAATRLALKKQQQVHMQNQETKSVTNITSSLSNCSSSNYTNSTTSTTTTTTSTSIGASSSELRKSMENMDDKTKTTPPPVLNKKPTVPVKKTTTVTSITGNILSGIKQKVKSVENKLTTSASHDYTDGLSSSKLSPGAVASDGGGSGGVVMRRAATIAEDSDFDRVERGSILTDMRAGRVKAPKRRPPSTAISSFGESNNNSLYVNGNGSDTTQSDDQLNTDDNSTGEDQLAKPKPREWEKKKAPWMAELKASQVKKKTSPNVEGSASSVSLAERTSKLFGDDVKISNQAVSNTNTTSTTSSASISSTKVQSSTVSSTSLMQQSMVVESSSSSSNSSNVTTNRTLTDAMTKSLSAKMANDAAAALSAAAASTNNNSFLNTTSNASTSSTSNVALEDVRVRPNSLSIRNRSASPSMAATRNVLKTNNTTIASTTTNSASPAETTSSNSHHSNSHTSSIAKTNNSSSSTSSNTTTNTAASVVNNHHHHHQQHHSQQLDNGTSGTAKQDSNRVADLESRVEKLESLIHTQQRTIDELVRTLREESDRNKILRAELDKYAQKPTRRGKFDNWMF